jgi:hypothetical protein
MAMAGSGPATPRGIINRPLSIVPQEANSTFRISRPKFSVLCTSLPVRFATLFRCTVFVPSCHTPLLADDALALMRPWKN